MHTIFLLSRQTYLIKYWLDFIYLFISVLQPLDLLTEQVGVPNKVNIESICPREKLCTFIYLFIGQTIFTFVLLRNYFVVTHSLWIQFPGHQFDEVSVGHRDRAV